MNIIIFSKDRSAQSRYRFSREMIEDLKAYHGIDAEAELTRLLSEELARNVDGSMIWGNYLKTKEVKRIYSELDPYGEENWEE
jgi:hypothetical protein